VDELQQVGAVVAPWTGLFGVLVAGLYAILRGKLVPSAQVDRLTAQWEARLQESHEREKDWMAAFARSEARGDVQAAQLGELMTVARTSEALLKALPKAQGG
jgi:hypothetical protein